MSHRRPSLTLLASLTAVFAIFTAACGRHDGPGPSPSPTLPPTSATSTAPVDPQQADRAAVTAVYGQFWRLVWTLDRVSAPQRRVVLAQAAVDPALGRAVAAAEVHQREGITLYGQVVPHPTAISFPEANRAMITDCQDAHAAGQADARTGRHKTVGVARSPVKATAVRSTDGAWRIAEATYTGGTC